MRVIKFRAWDKPHSKMCYSVNLYQSTSDSVNRIQLYPDNFMKTPGVHCELMQFTGLKDKNGKDIYEGDIMEAINGTGYRFGQKGEVKYNEDYGGFIVVGQWNKNQHHNSLTCDVAIETEVIGNIYDNPELLTP